MSRFYGFCTADKKGVTDNWADCQTAVKGKEAKFRKFPNRAMADAWVDNGCKKVPLPKGIYCDAGTGSGEGTEVRVTDRDGTSLLPSTQYKANSRGNILLDNKTNNYGELLGMHIALELALKHNIDKIFGDSRLVIEYWSKGHIKKDMPLETQELANKTKQLRMKFEEKLGEIEHISGDINPADLGYHK